LKLKSKQLQNAFSKERLLTSCLWSSHIQVIVDVVVGCWNIDIERESKLSLDKNHAMRHGQPRGLKISSLGGFEQ
jgi:hypothetical protein